MNGKINLLTCMTIYAILRGIFGVRYGQKDIRIKNTEENLDKTKMHIRLNLSLLQTTWQYLLQQVKIICHVFQ